MKAPADATARRPRDERLDLFRGLTMLIIFVAHMPGNSWNNYIPARFGFSSGTELFVFCSGVASAYAFGSIFVKRGLWLGAMRIAHRIWQVYWAHFCLVMAIIAIAALIDHTFDQGLMQSQFAPLLSEPARAIMSIATLTWLPDYLDILPMYIVILALVPVMMGLRRVNNALPFMLAALLYTLVWTSGLNLPGNPWSGAGWYLNPFAWQLAFFTGFAFAMKWLPVPRFCDRRLMIASAAILVAAFPLAFEPIRESWRALDETHAWILGSMEKGNLHLLRFVHFLALAYIVLSLIEPFKTRLDQGVGHLVIMIGRQSLGTFLASIVLARIGGVLAEAAGRSEWAIAVINLTAFTLLFAVAAALNWIKSAPWSGPSQAGRARQHETPLNFAAGSAHEPKTLNHSLTS